MSWFGSQPLCRPSSTKGSELDQLCADGAPLTARPPSALPAPRLIQAGRTGRDQRQPGVTHAENIRDYLLRHPIIGDEFTAIKTSQRDELKDAFPPALRKEDHRAALDESASTAWQRFLQEVRKGFGLEGLRGLQNKILRGCGGRVQPHDTPDNRRKPFVPAMQKGHELEVVEEDEWEKRLNALIAP